MRRSGPPNAMLVTCCSRVPGMGPRCSARIWPAHERLFNRVDVVRVQFFDHGLQRRPPSNRSSRLLIRLVIQMRLLLIEHEPVGPGAVAKRQDRSPASSAAPPARDRKSRQAPAERFHDVQPFADGVGPALVGVVQPVGDDARAALVDEHDESVGDVRTARRVAGAAAVVLTEIQVRPCSSVGHVVGGRQGDAVDLDEPRRERARRDRAARRRRRRRGSRCRNEPSAFRAMPLGRSSTPSFAREPRVLRAVGADDRDAAAPVGHEHIACRRAEHALRAMQAASERFERGGQGGVDTEFANVYDERSAVKRRT